ncbi:MAG: glycosyltransferase [Desulfamplus sp.]|nr:glycosyltransferase [Desulfamplus sp.]
MKKKNTTNIKLSACMMVKNEEEMLPRCLNSIKHLVDEIIVVDTGSTDATIAIAQSFGAKIYHHPWEQNFSKHRNQSISYATGDWFLIIDADEELDSYHLKKEDLKNKILKAPKELHCFLINLLDKDAKGNVSTVAKSARIFRNKVGVEYRGIVHNTAYYSGKVTEMDLNMFHYGYALPAPQMQAKYKRTSSLLLKRIDIDPNDYAAYFYLCQVYMQMEEPQQAIKYAQHCLDILPSEKKSGIDISFYYSLYHSIAMSYIALSKYDIAIDTIRKGLKLLPDEIDLYYDLACIGVFSNNFDLVVEGAENYLRVLDEFRNKYLRAGTRFVFSTSEAIQLTVEYWLMNGYISKERFNDALKVWERNRKLMLNKPSFLKELLVNLERKEAWDFIKKAVFYLFENIDKLETNSQKNILQYLIFCLRRDEDYENLETAISKYLDLIQNYRDIPEDTIIIIAEFLLKKGLSNFFLDITVELFEQTITTSIKVIDNVKIIANGYDVIAKKQPKNIKGFLLSSLCLNISWGLTEDDKYIESLTEIYNQQKRYN